MKVIRSMLVVMIVFAVLFSVAGAQNPPAGQRGGEPGAPGAPGVDVRGGGGRGGRGGGGGGVQTMTLTTTAWPDGGMIPLRYTQAGGETSPGVQWSGAPQGTTSFVLTFTDADTIAAAPPANAATTVPANPTDGLLHWMLWNIPGNVTNIAPGQPDGFELENGIRQISVSGSRYRGPGAPAAGPLHHYILQLYALDTMIDVKVNPQGPQEPNPNVQVIRGTVRQAMAGHIRGKATYVGLFHRPQ
jgi:Raf kinase inhibitor-like YbhB/YbcL family protein